MGLKIKIITVGSIKEKYLAEGIAHFEKEIGKKCPIECIEIADEKCPENLSASEMEQVKQREGQKIMDRIPAGAFVCTLEIEGKLVNTAQLRGKWREARQKGHDEMVFIIGGSLGLSDAVKAKSQFKLSFSPMTFPHQLMKLMLLEQLGKIVSL